MDDNLGADADLMIDIKPREDILVSICFSDLPATKAAFATIRELAQRLDARFRFREFVLIVDDIGHEHYLPLVEQIADLRLFTIRLRNSYYDSRVIAAEEAIGDVVLIGNFHEMAHIDFVEMVEQASRQHSILLATRAIQHPFSGGLSTLITALGRAAGFKVSLNDLQTIALPRSQLNQILLHSNPELALRFPPKDQRLPLSLFAVESNVPFRGGFHRFKRRLQLLQKLLVYMAPMLLLFVTLSSTLLTLLGIGYAIYTMGVWLFLDDLAAGWLTTSAMLSFASIFMGISILGVSLGLQQILNHRSKDNFENIANEINRGDLFGKVASDLNVVLERERPQVAKETT